MAAVGYHSNCCSISANSVSKMSSAPSTSALVLAPSLTGHRRLYVGKRKSALKKRVQLQGLRVQSKLAGGIGWGTFKLKNEEAVGDSESNIGSGTKKIQKLPGTVKLQGSNRSRPKDNKVVFVAGATGRVGSRTVRELLRLGFCVRAGTRDVEKAQALLEDGFQGKEEEEDSKPSSPFARLFPVNLFGFLSPSKEKQVEIVECDLEKPETIEPALGNAGVVVCCIGASEKEALNASGPYRIDYMAAKNLIDAASSAQVNHFVLLTSLGTQKFGFPAAVLNLFWGVLIWKAKAEQALIESGLQYTIVRPGGMERPTDAFKETHNLVLAEADTLFGGQVSNLQVAELLACVVENPDLSRNKVVEVVAETTAPLRPIEDLLAEISQREQKGTKPGLKGFQKVQPIAAAEAGRGQSKKLEEERLYEEKRLESKRQEEERRKKEELRVRYKNEIAAAKAKGEEARKEAEAALAEKAELEQKVAELRSKAEAAALASRQAKALEAAALAAAQKGQVLSEQEKGRVLASVSIESDAVSKVTEKPKAISMKAPKFTFPGGLKPASQSGEVPLEPITDKKQEVPLKIKAEEKKEEPSAEVEAQRKAEEIQRRAEEEKRKAEYAKIKADIEARVLAEQEPKQEAEKAAKARKNAEELAAAKARANTEKLAKEEAERKEKEAAAAAAAAAAAEAKRLENEKAEAEQLAKEKALAEAQQVSTPKTSKTFRWFWEPAEPESERSPVVKDAAATNPVKSTDLPPSSTPLSPYTMFPDLKPPSSPIPSPPIGEVQVQMKEESQVISSAKKDTAVEVDLETKAEKVADRMQDFKTEKDQENDLKVSSEELVLDAEERKRKALEVAAREKEALDKAKAATAFLWPWQSSEPAPETEPSTEEAPASVSPTLSTEQGSQILPRNSTPLSPYSMYEDLKPASSPTPKFPLSSLASGKEGQEDTLATTEAKTQIVPSSNEILKTVVDSEQASETPSDISLKDLAPPKTPLSPYTRFPDLKPPSSPMPSPVGSLPLNESSESIKVQSELQSGVLLQDEGGDNGAAVAEPEKAEERVPDPAITSGFRWPWQ